MADYILEMIGISKEFPGVKALSDVTFKVKRGEIHALVGENGAGKSTLMKILSGVYPYKTYEGKILINGVEQQFHNIKQSEKAKIAIIYQELALVKSLSVVENIFLGNEIAKYGVIQKDEMFKKTEEILKEVGLDINPTVKVLHLGVGQQQLVEIAKALLKEAEILVLDEPTAALTESESENLFKILRKLKSKGITCIFISHRLKEVFEVADTITVLRDGKTVITEGAKKLNEDRLISYMVGRELTERFPKQKHKASETILEVKNWTVVDPETEEIVCDNVSFEVKKNEILGVAGLMGAGRTELMMSIFGAYGRKVKGEIYLNGKKIEINSPKDAISYGICYLSEDRKQFGLVLNMSIQQNVSLANLENISSYSVINKNEEILRSLRYVDELKIKTPSIEQKAMNLSGGNQQKVVIAKWLMAEPKVLFLDEPTRGIDVGAKYEIYNIMNMLVAKGVGVVMISSELPEILGMSDRIIVMHEGKLTGELYHEEATQEKIMAYATNI
ncbi:MAG: xylose ABC transporter ATP-binding protein [Brevinematales bacterium]|nr:xylose ABC transporter ATP-binding protein [Brevinematales bacterium]